MCDLHKFSFYWKKVGKRRLLKIGIFDGKTILKRKNQVSKKFTFFPLGLVLTAKGGACLTALLARFFFVRRGLFGDTFSALAALYGLFSLFAVRLRFFGSGSAWSGCGTNKTFGAVPDQILTLCIT